MRKIYLITFLIAFAYNVKAIGISTSNYNLYNDTEKVLSQEKVMEFEYSFIEGLRFKLLGDYKMAIKWLNRCLEIDNTSAVVRYEIANFYIKNKDYDTAMNLLRDAIHYNSNNVWYQLQLANVYKHKSMIKQACGIYNSLYERDSEKIEFLYYQAGLYTSVENWDSAIKVYKQIEKSIGISEQVSLEKYKIYNKQKKYRKAEREISLLIKKFPNSAQYLALLGELYINNNKTKKTLALFERMLKLDKNNGYVYLFIADYYKENNDIDNYKKYLSLALSKVNIDINYKVQYIINLFISASDIGIKRTFISTLVNDLVNKYPSEEVILSLQADIYKADNNIKAARETVLKLISINKHKYTSWEGLILLDNQLGDFDSMKIHSQEAIKYFPEQALPYLLNAICYLINEDYNTALTGLSIGVKLIDTNEALLSQFYSYQAECYYNLKELEKAFVLYDKVLKIDPNNVVVLNNYSYYLSVANKDLIKAENMISKCIELEGDNSTYLDTYAWVLFKRKKYSEALFFIRRVMEIDSEKSAVLLEHYGDILFMNDQKEKAIEEWEKALKKGSESDLLKQKIREKRFIE